jgi:uncharacterized protein (DUF433 family)
VLATAVAVVAYTMSLELIPARLAQPCVQAKVCRTAGSFYVFVKQHPCFVRQLVNCSKVAMCPQQHEGHAIVRLTLISASELLLPMQAHTQHTSYAASYPWCTYLEGPKGRV